MLINYIQTQVELDLGYNAFALSRRSVRPSVSNSCPLYKSFTNGRISFKLE